MGERNFTFYVVAIPNEYTILVNGGAQYNEDIEEQGWYDNYKVRVGTKIEVILPGKEIVDPKSRDILGYYDSIKDTLEVVKIHPQFFECAKINKNEGIIGSLSPMFGVVDNGYLELNVNEQEIMHISYSSTDSEISIGDPVNILN